MPVQFEAYRQTDDCCRFCPDLGWHPDGVALSDIANARVPRSRKAAYDPHTAPTGKHALIRLTLNPTTRCIVARSVVLLSSFPASLAVYPVARVADGSEVG